MKITLEFESFQEMVAYCLKVAGPEVPVQTPAPEDKKKDEGEALKKRKAAAAKKKAEAAAKKKAEEEAAAEEDTSSDDASGDDGTEIEVDVTLDSIQAEVDRIRKLGRAATLKIRKYLDDNGIDRIGEMDADGYPDLYNFLKGVTK